MDSLWLLVVVPMKIIAYPQNQDVFPHILALCGAGWSIGTLGSPISVTFYFKAMIGYSDKSLLMLFVFYSGICSTCLLKVLGLMYCEWWWEISY